MLKGRVQKFISRMQAFLHQQKPFSLPTAGEKALALKSLLAPFVLIVALLLLGFLSGWQLQWVSVLACGFLLIGYHWHARKQLESMQLQRTESASSVSEPESERKAAAPTESPLTSDISIFAGKPSTTASIAESDVVDVEAMRAQVKEVLEAQLDLSFASFFQKKTSDSWGVLVRNSKDGGANSVLAAHVIRKTMGQLTEASGQVKEMLQSTESAARSVELLASISDGIRQLSEQSKFVSLNANIEAQRAGEHGKVFAVIATGLGKLAIDIRTMTEKTESILKQVQEDMKTNKDLCHRVALIFDGVDDELKQFNKLMMRIEELAQSQTQSFSRFEAEMTGISQDRVKMSYEHHYERRAS